MHTRFQVEATGRPGDPREGERGSLAALVALGMVALLGMAALSLDVAEAYQVKAGLANAAIVAAISGARELPGDPAKARQVATDVARANGVKGQVVVEVLASTPGGPLDQVRVTAQGTARFLFARVWGDSLLDLWGQAVAQAGTPRGMRGLVPIGVQHQTFHYGQTYTLKSGDPMVPGNFGLLALGGRGGSTVRGNLANGYPGEIQVGQQVETEPGNKVGPTMQGLNGRMAADPDATCATVRPGSPRLVYLPIVDFTGVHGRETVPVLGFAAFFLSSVNGGEVTGCFLRTVTTADWGPLDPNQDFGTSVVALVH